MHTSKMCMYPLKMSRILPKGMCKNNSRHCMTEILFCEDEKQAVMTFGPQGAPLQIEDASPQMRHGAEMG